MNRDEQEQIDWCTFLDNEADTAPIDPAGEFVEHVQAETALQ